MKLGAKTFDSEEFLRHFENIADFFEVQAIQEKDYDFIKRFDKEIVIHSEHQNWGVNNASKRLEKFNLKSIGFAQKLASRFNSKKIIVHPGNILEEDCVKEQSIRLLKSIDDERILIENLIPEKNGLCTSPNETKEFLELTNKGFILDINHAIESAVYWKKNYIDFLKEFITLKPSHYHIGGQKLIEKRVKGERKIIIDSHLSFIDSNIDLKKIFGILPKDAEITLEVSTDIKKTEYDFKLLKKFV